MCCLFIYSHFTALLVYLCPYFQVFRCQELEAVKLWAKTVYLLCVWTWFYYLGQKEIQHSSLCFLTWIFLSLPHSLYSFLAPYPLISSPFFSLLYLSLAPPSLYLPSLQSLPSSFFMLLTNSSPLSFPFLPLCPDHSSLTLRHQIFALIKF